MERHWEIVDKQVALIQKENDIYSIVLMGSVAYEKATAESDIDILVICNKDEFQSKWIDGIFVEIHYCKYSTLKKRLKSTPAEVYKYLYSKIICDDGKFKRLMNLAEDIYNNYQTPAKEKESIKYWLASTKLKLLSAINSGDVLKASYLISTNTWKVLEGVWAMNDKPMPPSSIAFHFYNKLVFNIENWFDSLMIGEPLARAKVMVKIIDSICNV